MKNLSDIKILIIIIIIIIIIVISLSFICNSKYFKNNEYLYDNDWSIIPNKVIYAKLNNVEGIEVRILPSSHLLSGQKGVFATKKFSKYNIIGEYTGLINFKKNIKQTNLYLFNLNNDVIIDAKDFGNELRFINSYLNIRDSPNLSAQYSFIGGYPRVLYICIKDIEIGEELLVDYGDSYNKTHIIIE